jgi:hypothetical protein
LEALEGLPGVLRAGLAGDHLRAITSQGMDAAALRERLSGAGIAGAVVEKVEPTLEDVFLALATKEHPDKV